VTRVAPKTGELVFITNRIGVTAKRAAEIFDDQGGLCRHCKGPLAVQPFEVDHRIALALGGTNDRKNLEAICVPCHKAKTARDVKAIAKAKRIARREAGENKRSRKIAGKPLGGGPLRRKMSGEVVPR